MKISIRADLIRFDRLYDRLILLNNNVAPYGKFSFRKYRFPDAKGMIGELHALGFKIMLWVCPFISPDSEVSRDLLSKKVVLMSNEGNASSMVNEYGLDGFKFDAGDPEYYPESSVPFKNITANEQTRLWGLFALDYPLNEYRAMWQRGNEPIVERPGINFTRIWKDKNGVVINGPVKKQFYVPLDELLWFKNNQDFLRQFNSVNVYSSLRRI